MHLGAWQKQHSVITGHVAVLVGALVSALVGALVSVLVDV